MKVHVTLSTSCVSGVIDLGTYTDDEDGELQYARTELLEEAICGMGNCTIEEYNDNELVSLREYTPEGCTTIKLSDVPGVGGLAILET